MTFWYKFLDHTHTHNIYKKCELNWSSLIYSQKHWKALNYYFHFWYAQWDNKIETEFRVIGYYDYMLFFSFMSAYEWNQNNWIHKQTTTLISVNYS